MAGRADEHLVATKLFAPRARTALVLRERLLDLLRAGLDVPLTVVEAPAGWGKSTLVSDWLRQDGVDAGWVSLDHTDDDPHQFWRYLLLGASRAVPPVGEDALRRLDAAGCDVQRDVVPAFVNDVVASGRRLVVVLDDYHVIGNPQVHSSVELLLDRCPEQLHVVLITRSDPPLPVSRMRVRGELVEVHAGS